MERGEPVRIEGGEEGGSSGNGLERQKEGMSDGCVRERRAKMTGQSQDIPIQEDQENDLPLPSIILLSSSERNSLK